jgi:uncharacterized protein (TIGR02594 family)
MQPDLSHLMIALAELGQEEYTDLPDIERENPRIVEYLASVDQEGDDEIPWCAAFVNWVLLEAGISGTGKGLARDFLPWSIEATDPKMGDVVVLKRGKKAWQGHVGFLMDKYGDSVYILGGNQKNRVGINTYPTKDILSIRNTQFMYDLEVITPYDF